MTSIEWLINQIYKKQYGDYPNLTFENIFKEAEKMHKQEIIDAYHINPQEAKWKNIGVNYYNETFGSKGNATSEFDKPFIDFAKQYFKPKK